jgi:hypothetical protein
MTLNEKIKIEKNIFVVHRIHNDDEMQTIQSLRSFTTMMKLSRSIFNFIVHEDEHLFGN